jgi:hypothetical protein
MTRRSAKLLLLFALPLFAQEGAVEGVALNKLTKAPVAGVRVRLAFPTEPGKYYDGVTGADGKYRIENLPVGEYSPNITAPTGFFGPSVMEMAVRRTRVPVKEGVARFDVEIVPASVIRGRVVDPDRRPVAKMVVLAVGGIQLGMDRTDEEGRFSVNVAPGTYRLIARPVSDKLAPTYYPSFPDEASGERIVVGEGLDLGGYEIRLQPFSGNRLRGVVRDDQGKPVAGVEITISARDVKAKSNAEGMFEFTAIRAGDWLISATTSREGERWYGSAPVSMPNRDYDKAELRIDPPFAVDVELEGTPRERRMPLRFELRPASLASLNILEQSGRTRFQRVYPGSYRLAVWGVVPGHYLKSILLGTTDVTGRTFDLSPSSPPPLRLVYAPGPGRVTGEVEGGAGAKVVLISADRETYVPGMDSITIYCDDKGRFTMNDLRPGDWYALAVAGSSNTMAIRDRMFGRVLWRQATAFRVAERETANLNLKIQEWPE